MPNRNIIWFENLRMTDVEIVGGKNASLGEMISQLTEKGVRVPNGFATTASAYRKFLAHNGLNERISAALAQLDVEDVVALAQVGKNIRQWILDTPFPAELDAEINEAWQTMVNEAGSDQISVAVRSSATAEDLPDASFAGQQETFLNINGLDNVKEAMKHVFASLYNDRAISYRVHKGFAHDVVALSAGVQRMVRSDSGAAGVMFSIDTESGFEDVVFITASYGLGETVVQGAVNPDEFYVHKPTLNANRPAILRKTLGAKQIKMIFSQQAQAGKSVQTIDVPAAERRQFAISDAEITELAQYAVIIEQHYGRPMDIEWGRDGIDGKLYILQARPETVKSQEKAQGNSLQRYTLSGERKVLIKGRAIGQKIGQGKVRLVKDASEMDQVQTGDVLVADITDPDWEPVMKRASAIITNRGGRTCHAAIIARELGIPAVVGCGNATELLTSGQEVTVSCAEGDTGLIYQGLLDVKVDHIALDNMPQAPVKIMMNVGNPELAFSFAKLPSEGIGLARMEFIINRQIGIHPQALIEFDRLDSDLQEEISERIAGYASPVEFYVDKIAEGVATLAASVYPRKAIVRMSDFKSNEYAGLIGGDLYEPHEENPMIGFRGAARYVSKEFSQAFALECQAIKHVRDEMGLTNVEVMIPFVRTLQEARQVVETLKANGLERGKNGLRLIMMCEVPSNAILAEQFLAYFDGFSIGSNDMTQLTLGVDRDSGGPIAATFDERNEAVKAMLSMAIQACRKQGKYVGICGQGPSDHPDFAQWLVEEGIETLSLNPDTVIETWLYLAENIKH
ncbi:phosphoenolpyruvate synthase [Actinobacillus equuli]|uniref:Phosphoenolpyruvate synthase n=1 Tax=Actinobacillus equuli TaxID=718 RepID=A0AAX3FJ29_ACTEU|nr:phosphoenolpyruvate synthase [Actinobacillus equuli]AIZ79840.1 phosphoenolpyruvate synthase [Actinobacillus equuli subsp. equuli]WGE43951.1 phosphoenolpyruvate synthase [Actinobacillus equuli subsp. equuli]VEE90758.1 phosphoenolpyruvate synthase [Actinobacillus equuli]